MDEWKEEGRRVEGRMESVDGSIDSLFGPLSTVLCVALTLRGGLCRDGPALACIGPAEAINASIVG